MMRMMLEFWRVKLFIIIFSVFLFAPVIDRTSAASDYTQCSLRHNSTCYQYSLARRRNLTCAVNGDNFRNCQQIGNTGALNLTCVAPGACKQKCLASNCQSLKCNSKKCNQYCIRGRCNMECNSDECVQECDVSGCEMTCPAGAKRCIQKCSRGNCKMHCPSGVQYCKQSCNKGRCIMLCDRKNCSRSCRHSKCFYNAEPENVAAPTFTSTCNRAIARTQNICYQHCLSGDCKMMSVDGYSMQSQVCYGGNCNMSCNAGEKCSQVCVGRQCQLVTCTSDICIQECIAGGCHMECYSKICTQICRKGNCRMACLSSNSKVCYQTCVGGGCLTSCEGENCSPRCFGGNCKHSLYQPPGLITTEACDEIKGETCVQKCSSKIGCAVMNRPSNPLQISNQTCSDGFCLLNCTGSDVCNQVCSGQKCYTLSCNSRECFQVCSGKDCGLLECYANTCTQKCTGWGCHLKCHPSVDVCHQICIAEKGKCSLECWAKQCITTML